MFASGINLVSLPFSGSKILSHLCLVPLSYINTVPPLRGSVRGVYLSYTLCQSEWAWGEKSPTGALLTCPPHSAIKDHCEQTCLGPVSYDDFNILAVAPDLVSLRILESLHIFKSKPKLNDSNSSFPLNIVL